MCRGLPLLASAAAAPVIAAVSPPTTWTARTAGKTGAVKPTSTPRIRLAVAIGDSLSCSPNLYVATLHIGIRVPGVLPGRRVKVALLPMLVDNLKARADARCADPA